MEDVAAETAALRRLNGMEGIIAELPDRGPSDAAVVAELMKGRRDGGATGDETTRRGGNTDKHRYT
jgi:hypothetical protein